MRQYCIRRGNGGVNDTAELFLLRYSIFVSTASNLISLLSLGSHKRGEVLELSIEST